MCDACGWKNIFQADGSELRPELISSLSWEGYVCPACRSDQSTSRMVLSTPVPYGVLFEGEDEDTGSVSVVEQGDTARMTAWQHLRALAHLLAPWDAETGGLIAVIGVFYLGILLIALAFRNWGLAEAIGGLFWLCAQFYLILFCLPFAGMIAIGRILNGKAVWKNLRIDWCEAGEEVLFPNLRRELSRRRYERDVKARMRRVNTTE